jgi:hypothetical protein
MDGGLVAGRGEGGEGVFVGPGGDGHAVEEMADAGGGGLLRGAWPVEFEFGFEGGGLVGRGEFERDDDGAGGGGRSGGRGEDFEQEAGVFFGVGVAAGEIPAGEPGGGFDGAGAEVDFYAADAGRAEGDGDAGGPGVAGGEAGAVTERFEGGGAAEGGKELAGAPPAGGGVAGGEVAVDCEG